MRAMQLVTLLLAALGSARFGWDGPTYYAEDPRTHSTARAFRVLRIPTGEAQRQIVGRMACVMRTALVLNCSEQRGPSRCLNPVLKKLLRSPEAYTEVSTLYRPQLGDFLLLDTGLDCVTSIALDPVFAPMVAPYALVAWPWPRAPRSFLDCAAAAVALENGEYARFPAHADTYNRRLAEFGQVLQRCLHEVQHPRFCTSSRIEVNDPFLVGFGGVVLHEVKEFAYAVNDGYIWFPTSNFSYSKVRQCIGDRYGSWSCFFLPPTNCTPEMVPERHRRHRRWWDSFAYITPPSMYSTLATALEWVDSGFITQQLMLYMLRMQPDVAHAVQNEVASRLAPAGARARSVGMHFRSGHGSSTGFWDDRYGMVNRTAATFPYFIGVVREMMHILEFHPEDTFVYVASDFENGTKEEWYQSFTDLHLRVPERRVANLDALCNPSYPNFTEEHVAVQAGGTVTSVTMDVLKDLWILKEADLLIGRPSNLYEAAYVLRDNYRKANSCLVVPEDDKRSVCSSAGDLFFRLGSPEFIWASPKAHLIAGNSVGL